MITITEILLLTANCLLIISLIEWGIANEFGSQKIGKELIQVSAQLVYDYSIYSVAFMVILFLVADMIAKAAFLRMGLNCCLNIVRDIYGKRFDDEEALKCFEEENKLLEKLKDKHHLLQDEQIAQEFVDETAY